MCSCFALSWLQSELEAACRALEVERARSKQLQQQSQAEGPKFEAKLEVKESAR